jgi:hypothetical protein
MYYYLPPALSQNLIERRYSNSGDWANDICSSFEAVLDDPGSSPLERHAARTLAQTVMSKIGEIDDDRSILGANRTKKWLR